MINISLQPFQILVHENVKFLIYSLYLSFFHCSTNPQIEAKQLPVSVFAQLSGFFNFDLFHIKSWIGTSVQKVRIDDNDQPLHHNFWLIFFINNQQNYDTTTCRCQHIINLNLWSSSWCNIAFRLLENMSKNTYIIYEENKLR